MKEKSSKRLLCIKLIALIMIFFIIFASFRNHEEESIVLCGLLDKQEQAVSAFNYVWNKTFMSSDGSMTVSTPDGWCAQEIDAGGFSSGVLSDKNGAGHIQLHSYRLAETDNSATPDSIIEQF